MVNEEEGTGLEDIWESVTVIKFWNFRLSTRTIYIHKGPLCKNYGTHYSYAEQRKKNNEIFCKIKFKKINKLINNKNKD